MNLTRAVIQIIHLQLRICCQKFIFAFPSQFVYKNPWLYVT